MKAANFYQWYAATPFSFVFAASSASNLTVIEGMTGLFQLFEHYPNFEAAVDHLITTADHD